MLILKDVQIKPNVFQKIYSQNQILIPKDVQTKRIFSRKYVLQKLDINLKRCVNKTNFFSKNFLPKAGVYPNGY